MNNQIINESYDIIVIGAGNGWLTACCEVAMKGV